MKHFWAAYDHFLVTTSTWEYALAMFEVALIGFGIAVAFSMKIGIY